MNLSINSAVEFSHVWLLAMGRASVEGGIALLLVWIICRSITRLPARVKCWLWHLAYLKLAIALLWATPVELRVLRPLQVQSAAALPPPLAGFANPVDAHPPAQSAPIHFVLAKPAPAPYVPHLQPTDLLALCILGLWTLTVLGLSMRLFRQWQATQRFRHNCVAVTDPALNRLCTTLVQSLGLRTSPPLMLSDQNISPLLLGIFRPAIVLPAAMLNAPANELRLMLSHELAHLARRDLPWNLFFTVIEALFFFHPLVWLSRRENRLAQEIAADHAALALTSTPAASYGQTLLEVASRSWAPRLPLTAGVVTSRKTLERRLIAMRHLPQWTRRNLAAAGIGISFVAAVALPSWQLVAQQSPAHATTTQNTTVTRQGEPKPGGHLEIFPATVSGGDTYKLQASTDGFIREFHGAAGEIVHKGDLVFALDDRRAKLSLEVAKLQLQQSRWELEQDQKMLEKKVIGVFDIARAKLELQSAEARLGMMELDLEETRIIAPAVGWLQYPRHIVGEYVGRGTLLAEIAGLRTSCKFDLPKRLVSQTSIGQKVEYRSGRGAAFEGRIIYIADATYTPDDTVEVRVQFQNETDLNVEGGQVAISFENKVPGNTTQGAAVPPK